MPRAARIGFLLLALAPLAYLPGAFTHDDVPKRLLVLAAAFLLVIEWLAPAVRTLTLDVRRDRFLLPLILSGGAAFVSFIACSIRGGNPYEAFWPLSLSASGVVLYLVASHLPGDDRFLRGTLPRWVVGAACVVAVYGLLQRAGIDPLNPAWANPDREAGSTLGGTTFAGEYLALVFPLALALAFLAVSRAGRAAAAGAALLIGAHLLVTGARGAWMGAGAGAGLFVLLGLVKRVGPERRRAIPPRSAAVAAGAVLAVAVVAQLAGVVDWVGRIRGAVAPASGRDTALVRRELWKSTVKMAADHPVFGVGPGQYELNIQPYRSVAEMRESDPQRLGRAAGMAHNDFLQHVAETGAIGGAVLVLLLVTLVRKSAAHLKGQLDREAFLLTAGLLAGALGAAGAGIVGNALHQPAVGALAMLFLGVAERVGNPALRTRTVMIARSVGVSLILFAGIMAGGGLVAGVSWVMGDMAYVRFLAAQRSATNGSNHPNKDDVTVSICQTLLSASAGDIPLVGGRWDVRRSLGLFELASSSTEAMGRAEGHLARAKVLSPNDPETRNAWGLLCRRQGKRDEGRQAFERAVQLDPVVRQPRLNLALAYDQDGMPGLTLAQYEGLVHLDPRDAEAHLWRGLTLVNLGRQAEAASAFTAAERADRYAEPVLRFDLRGTLQRDDKWKAFRESEPGRAWLGGKRD